MKGVAFVVLGMLWLTPAQARAESALDVPLPVPARTGVTLAPLPEGKGLPIFMERLARASGVPIVFEVDIQAATLTHPVNVTGSTVRDVLNFFVQAYPSYEWKENGGVAVIRPRAEWSDPTCFFNRPLPSAAMTDVTAHDVFQYAVQHVWGIEKPSGSQEPDPHLFSVSPQGTVIDLLIAAARARGDMVWLVGSLFGQFDRKPDFALGYVAFTEDGSIVPDIAGVSGLYNHPKFRQSVAR
jgi:hypothetical protein